MTTVIKAENISKQYKISHQKSEGYKTLSDSLSNFGERIINRIKHPLSTTPNEEIETFEALKDINFEIKQGDRIGIIGRNGAGKSTLLKLLSRITAPSTGTIGIKGRVASLLEVGTGFHPELTGRENIFLNGAILGMSKRDIGAKFDEIVSFAEVMKFLDTPVKRYSSGMYVRLAFAIAAHMEPDILIVDEVLAVGDVAFQRKCLGSMQNNATQGRTIIFVSHQMSAINNLCNRGLVLSDGRVRHNSSASSAIDFYLSQNSENREGFSDFSNNNTYRTGNTPLITSVGLLDKKRKAYRSWIKTGETLDIEIRYLIHDIYVDYCFLAFSNTAGERVFSCGTHLDRGFNKKLQGTGKLICSIPNFPLVDGEYTLDVSLGTKARGNLDHISRALSFRVELSNYFQTGQVILPGQGHFAVNSHWSLV